MTRQNYDTDETIRTATVDEDAEWQRVNSYVADVLKDCYVLFAKLARLRGDFAGTELSKLDEISAHVRDVGQSLASFSKSFNEGEYSMNKKEQFGDEGGDMDIPTDFEPTAEDFDFSVEPEGGEEGGGEDEEEGPPLEEFGEEEGEKESEGQKEE